MWFGIGIKILLENRQVIELLKSEFKGKSILDCAATDYVSNCEKCHSATGWLYNETCWFRVDEIIPLAQIPHLLPGHLQDNHTVRLALHAYSMEPTFLPRFIADLLAQRSNPAEGWEPSQWICRACFFTLMKHGLVGWFKARLIEDGYVFKENCRSGYNCHTQATLEHAGRLNHLCEPAPLHGDGIE